MYKRQVLGTPDELEAADILPAKAGDDGTGLRVHHHHAGAGLLHRIASLLGSDDNSALRFAIVAASTLIVVSTVILRTFYRMPGGGHMTVLTSLYFTVETISTVGYGDFSFAHQSSWVLVFGIVLIGAGATLLTAVFALITNLLVSWRIDQSLGRQKVVGMVDHVVCLLYTSRCV